MSVIIRLQNLPWSANALDIRQFFTGLSIPEGGVHIVGGELGDAFIAFSTDEDARQAFNRSGGKIKEIQVKLLLSSRTEMQKVIEAARSNTFSAFQLQGSAPLPAAIPPVMPAAIPEIRKEDSKSRSRDKRRSRSKSKERTRDRRRHRDRSRSRSRDRRERRRRERSRTRSRDRDRNDRRSRDKKDDRKKPEVQQVWANPPDVANLQNLQASLPVFATRSVDIAAAASLLSATNGFPNNAFNNQITSRQEPWGQSNFLSPPNFLNRDFLVNPNQQQQQQRLNPVQMNSLPLGLGGNGMRDRKPQSNHYQNQDNSYGDEDLDDYAVNCCVQVQPFFGGYGEIRRFFQGLFISNKGIKFINDGQGHRTGVAYIQFGHAQGKEEALKRDGEILNGCKVRVSHIIDEDFENAVDRFVPADNFNNQRVEEDDGRNFRTKNITKYFNNRNNRANEPELKEFQCVIVDDLPTYAKEQDILHMFSLHPLFSLILTTKPRGGNIAYVKFSTKEVAQKAYEEKQHHVVSGKQVTVRPCTDDDFELINKQHDVDINGTKPTEKIECLVLTRLPPNSNDRDIADFFSDIGVIPIKVHLINGPMGFTGQAFCEFDSQDETNKALKKDNTVFGNVKISVKPSTRKDMLAALGNNVEQIPSPTLPPPPIVNQVRPMMNMTNDNKPPRMQMMNNMNMNNMNPRMQFPNQRPFFNRNNFGGPNFTPRGGPRFGPRGGGPRFRFNAPPMNQGNMENPMNQANMENPMDDGNMENTDDAPPGCTIYMDNVPYKAGTAEILSFFDGYNVTNNVSRRYNPNNTPSPEARVIFHTKEEAFRALQERNGEKIWDRSIYLTQA